MNPRLQKGLLIVLFALSFVTIGSMSFLEDYFYRTRPRVPDPKNGRLCVHDINNARGFAQVYLTRSDKLLLDCLWYSDPMLFTAIVLAAYVLGGRGRRGQI